MLSSALTRIYRLPNINLLSSRRFLMEQSSSKGPIQLIIEKKLADNFKPSYLCVLNESYKHGVPKGSESHFKVVVVSENFKGQALLKRHRSINEVLKNEIDQIHALAIEAKTAEQWEGHSQPTPNCLGGSKFDKQKLHAPQKTI